MIESLPRLIIVDDDAELAAMLHDYLEMQGFSVETAGDAETGLQRIAASEPDLVILDVMLPGMSGIEVLNNVRQLHPETACFILSGDPNTEDAMNCIEQGYRLIEKPCTPETLEAIMVQNTVLNTTQT
jgi:DNA-binding response OmpR family regulator